MTQPQVLMLDEPTAGVSPIVMDELFDRIIEVARSGISILMVEQNARQALNIADKGYVLNATQAASLEMGRERLLLNDEAKRVYLAADGSAPPMGVRRRYTDLAATLKLLKSVGPKAIYGGAIGQKIVDDLQQLASRAVPLAAEAA